MADNRDDFIISIRYALLKKGAKEKFSLFFLISFSIIIIALDKFSITPVKVARSIINDIVYEVAFVASSPGKLISNVNKKRIKHFNIVNQNETLKAEIKILKEKSYASLFLKTENEYLKQALDVTNVPNDFQDKIVAKVILDKESPFLKSLIINKGGKHGVIKGMTVFSKGYLIGKIIESNYLTSRVLLITDLNSKIPVIIQGEGINAILGGTGKKTRLTLDYLPDEFLPEPDKIIYTSGKGGFLTAGMPVAKTYLSKKNKILIKSLADPQQALIVHVTRGQFNK